MTDSALDDFQVISLYTRQDAIEDGQQFLASGELAKIVVEVGYRYPLYYTNSVKSLIDRAVANPKHMNEFNGVFFDLMYMSRRNAVALSESRSKFQCIITGVGRKRTYEFYIEVGAVDCDNPAPCLTLMMVEDL